MKTISCNSEFLTKIHKCTSVPLKMLPVVKQQRNQNFQWQNPAAMMRRSRQKVLQGTKVNPECRITVGKGKKRNLGRNG
jgi:hypothetical protein